MAETLNINRERRALRVLERLDKRRSQGKFDFTIIVGKQKIFAEQNVLACGSDYFEAMLSHDTKERQTGEVDMLDVSFESVETCIGFIYGREVTVSIEKYENLMFATHMMQLEELCDAMEEKMTRQLTLNTFYTIQGLALKFGLVGLNNACKRFAEGNLGLLCKDNKFNALEKTFIVEIMQSDRVQIDEENKLKIVLSWVKDDIERSKILLEMLKCIDVSKISKEVMRYYIRDEPLIRTDAECLRFISLSIIESLPPRSQKKRILIFGKESQNLQLYYPDDDTIQNLHISKPNSNFFSVVCLHDYIYCLCKDKSGYRLRYTDLGATWERMKDMIKEHGSCPPAAVLSGRIYVIGGHNGFYSSAVECYNPWNDNWQPLESLPNAIAFAEVLASEGYVYRFGGKVGGQYVKDVARLDVLTLQWETLSPMSECKGHVSATKFKGMIYIAGGYVGTAAVRYFKTFECYSPSTNQWSLLPQMNIGRSYFNIFAVSGFLYAVGGYYSSPDSIEKYDIETNEWKMVIVSSEKLDIATSIAFEV